MKWNEMKWNETRLNFASKTGHLDWYSNNLDLYETSKINIYNFFLLATHAIRSATFQFLLVINSNYGAISDRHGDTRPMTLIWRYKDTKGRTDYFIRFATHDLMPFYSRPMTSYLCFIVTMAIFSHGTLFSAVYIDLIFQGHQRPNWLCFPIRDLWLGFRYFRYFRYFWYF